MNESINQVTIFGIKISSLKISRSSYINYQIILGKNIIIVGEVPKLVDTCNVIRLLIDYFVSALSHEVYFPYEF